MALARAIHATQYSVPFGMFSYTSCLPCVFSHLMPAARCFFQCHLMWHGQALCEEPHHTPALAVLCAAGATPHDAVALRNALDPSARPGQSTIRIIVAIHADHTPGLGVKVVRSGGLHVLVPVRVGECAGSSSGNCVCWFMNWEVV